LDPALDRPAGALAGFQGFQSAAGRCGHEGFVPAQLDEQSGVADETLEPPKRRLERERVAERAARVSEVDHQLIMARAGRQRRRPPSRRRVGGALAARLRK